MSQSYKILFAGTPDFSVAALQTLIDSSHTLVAVYTQPDRPSGRGRHLTASPVKQLALTKHIPVHQPLTLRDQKEQDILKSYQADVMVVVAYGLLLPTVILQAPRLGCINIHASLLPRWRGAAPIQHAILAGDVVTGVTIMKMDEGLDTGPMLYREECPISMHDTSEILHRRLAEMGARALLITLDQLETLVPVSQNNDLATYAKKIAKEDAKIRWEKTAVEIDRAIRAYNPWPVAFTTINDHTIRIWAAEVIQDKSNQNMPGTIIKASPQGLDVITGEGILRIQKMQMPGGKILSVAEVLNAHRDMFSVGTLLQ